jgi:hypothetical protein
MDEHLSIIFSGAPFITSSNLVAVAGVENVESVCIE